MTLNCGNCLQTTTNTSVMCSNVPANGGHCVLSVQTEPCGGTSKQVVQLKGTTIVNPGNSIVVNTSSNFI